MKIGAALTGVVVVVCIVLLATVDGSENSTSAIAYVLLPIYAVVAIMLIWLGVFLTRVIRRASREARVANRNGG